MLRCHPKRHQHPHRQVFPEEPYQEGGGGLGREPEPDLHQRGEDGRQPVKEPDRVEQVHEQDTEEEIGYRLADEPPHPHPGLRGGGPEVRHPVGRDLEEYLGALPGHHPVQDQPHRDVDKREGCKDQRNVAHPKRPEHPKDHRDLGHARDRKRHEGGGDEPLLLRLEHPGGERPRHVAPKPEEDRDDPVAVHPEPVEEGVGQRRKPREVAGILEDREDKVEGHDVGEDHRKRDEEPCREEAHRLDVVDLAVEEVPDQDLVQDPRPKKIADPHGNRGVEVEERFKDERYEPFADHPDRHERDGDDRKCNENAARRPDARLSDPVAEGVVAVSDRLHCARDPADRRPPFLLAHGPDRRRGAGFAEPVHEFPYPLPGETHGRDDRHAEEALEAGDIDRDSLVACLVPEVERDGSRDPALQDLEGQVEVPLKVRRVDDVDDDIRLREDPGGDLFCRVCGGEGVGAGCVDHLGRRIRKAHRPAGDVDGGPGVV